MKKIILILTIVLFIACGAEVETQSNESADFDLLHPSEIDFSEYTGDMPNYYGKIVDVADGDTFYIDWFTEDKMGVRVKGIDTPETVDSRKDVQYWGPEASEYTKSILKPGTIICLDFNAEITGPFGRLLAYVYYWDGNEWVYWNEQILKDGMAFVYPDYRFAYIEEFLEYQSYAIENENGMWANPEKINNNVVTDIEELFNHPKAGWFRADTRRENPDLYDELKE